MFITLKCGNGEYEILFQEVPISHRPFLRSANSRLASRQYWDRRFWPSFFIKVLQYSIAAPLVSSIGCRWGAAVLTADTPISSKGAFFQPWQHSCLWSQTLTWLIKAFSCVPSYFKNSQKWTVGRKTIKNQRTSPLQALLMHDWN